MFRNMASKVNPSCGGFHFIIPSLSLLYVSNSHCFLHMFLGRIRNALSRLRWSRCKGTVCVGWLWRDSPAIALGQDSESDALRNALQSQGLGTEWSSHSLRLAFTSCLWTAGSVGNLGDTRRVGGIRCLSTGSPFHFLICDSKRLLMTTEYFTLWEICSFCFCFCPHWMFLSALCEEGIGNYRAIHLHPHNFRQIL